LFGQANEPVTSPVRFVALAVAAVTAMVLVAFVLRGQPNVDDAVDAVASSAETQIPANQDAETGALSASSALPEDPPTENPPTETLADVSQVIPGRAVHVPSAGQDVIRLPAPPVAAPPPRPVNLGIVVVESANRLSTRRGMVTLAGTQGVASHAICQLEDGRTPACEVLARTAMRRFVGQRSVSCILGLREDAGEDHTAPCTAGDSDLSLWVVAHGWAFADGTASAELRAAEIEARSEQRGLWVSLSN
jgi:endonuclease YncB( thermonuclease family)